MMRIGFHVQLFARSYAFFSRCADLSGMYVPRAPPVDVVPTLGLLDGAFAVAAEDGWRWSDDAPALQDAAAVFRVLAAMLEECSRS